MWVRGLFNLPCVSIVHLTSKSSWSACRSLVLFWYRYWHWPHNTCRDGCIVLQCYMLNCWYAPLSCYCIFSVDEICLYSMMDEIMEYQKFKFFNELLFNANLIVKLQYLTSAWPCPQFVWGPWEVECARINQFCWQPRTRGRILLADTRLLTSLQYLLRNENNFSLTCFTLIFSASCIGFVATCKVSIL